MFAADASGAARSASAAAVPSGAAKAAAAGASISGRCAYADRGFRSRGGAVPRSCGTQSSLLAHCGPAWATWCATAQHVVNVHVVCVGKAVWMEDLLAGVMPLSRAPYAVKARIMVHSKPVVLDQNTQFPAVAMDCCWVLLGHTDAVGSPQGALAQREAALFGGERVGPGAL